MKHSFLRYPLLTLAIAVAAGCGGSEPSGTGGNGDNFAFDASAYKQKPGPDMAGGGTAGTAGTAGAPGSSCGDMMVSSSEQCDGTNLGGQTCATATMGVSMSGTLRCRSNCTFDTTGCLSNAGGGNVGAGGGQGTGAGPNTGAGGGP